MLIFTKLSDLESNIILSKKLTHYTCACLSLGGKLEYSGSNYADELVNINSKKISKEELNYAEYFILDVLAHIFRF